MTTIHDDLIYLSFKLSHKQTHILTNSNFEIFWGLVVSLKDDWASGHTMGQ